MLQLKNVSLSFDGNMVLENINFSSSGGIICGLFGQNGAGKTSLLKLMCGSLFPTAGTVAAFGKEPGKRLPEVSGDIFMLPELCDEREWRGIDYRKYYAPFYPRFSQADYQDYLQRFGYDEKMPLGKMSQGAQKKFLLSFALACNCRLTLLDEPTNGLDITSKAILRKILLGWIEEDKLLIISSHQARELNNIVDRVLVLNGAHLILDSYLDEVRANYIFGMSYEAPEDALYCKKAPLGYNYIARGSGGGEIDLELLYEAALQQAGLDLPDSAAQGGGHE